MEIADTPKERESERGREREVQPDENSIKKVARGSNMQQLLHSR